MCVTILTIVTETNGHGCLKPLCLVIFQQKVENVLLTLRSRLQIRSMLRILSLCAVDRKRSLVNILHMICYVSWNKAATLHYPSPSFISFTCWSCSLSPKTIGQKMWLPWTGSSPSQDHTETDNSHEPLPHMPFLFMYFPGIFQFYK